MRRWRTAEGMALVAVIAVLLTACERRPSDPAAPTSTGAMSITPTTTTAAVDPDAAQPLIDHVLWTITSQGRELQVYPTAAGRTDQFPAAGNRAWAEVLAAAPDANTPGMSDQFQCHWVFARLAEPDKPSWNLEPWRPDVGYAATVAAACNPGGPEE